MADGNLRLIPYAPGGWGLSQALGGALTPGAFLTSFDDEALGTLRHLVPEGQDIEIVPFGDLTGRFCNMVGQPTRLLASVRLQQAIMGETCHEPPFAAFGDSARTPGFWRLATRALSDFRRFGFGSPEIRELASRLEGRLADKVLGLSEVAGHMEERLGALGREHALDRILRILGCDHDGPYPVKDLVVLIGQDPRPLYGRFIQWLGSRGVRVKLLVEAGRHAGVFRRADAAAVAASGLIPGKKRKETWCDALFSPATTGAGPEAHVCRAPDPLAEVEWVVRKCIGLRTESGTPKIGIFARDADIYAPLIAATSARMGLLVAVPRMVPLLSNGFALFCLDLMRGLAGRDVRKMRPVVQSTYIGLSLADQSTLWDALQTAHRSKEGPWEALAAVADENQERWPWLNDVLIWRAEAVAGRANLRVWSERLITLMGLTRAVDRAVDNGGVTSERDTRAQTVLQTVIKERVDPREPGPDLTFGAFLTRATEWWRQEKVSVPSDRQPVSYCYQTHQLVDFDTVFVLGLLEGRFPKRVREDPLFSDDEIGKLFAATQGALDLVTSRVSAQEERDEFVRLCGSAKARLCLSYPEPEEDSDLRPPFYLEELTRALEGRVTEHFPPRRAFAPGQGECSNPADLSIRAALDGERADPVRVAPQQAVIAPRLSEGWRAGLSYSELALAAYCPFHSFFRYRAKVRGTGQTTLLGSLRDVPSEADLAALPPSTDWEAALRHAARRRLDDLNPDLDEWELGLLEAAVERLIPAWVEEEGAARQYWGSPSDMRKGVPSSQIGFRSEFKADDITYGVEEYLGLYYTLNGYDILHVFGSSAIDLRDGLASLVDTDPAGAKVAYLLFGLHCRQGSGQGVVYEVPDKGRTAYLYPKPPPGMFASRSSSRLTTISSNEPASFLFGPIRTSILSSLKRLTSGAIEPLPGQHCRSCRFGEVCRSHNEYGDSAPVDIFDDVRGKD